MPKTYEERPIFFERDFPGCLDGVVDRENVVTVDPDGRDAVRGTPVANGINNLRL